MTDNYCEAYYLDGDVLIHGYLKDGGFWADYGTDCGVVREINKDDTNKRVFRRMKALIRVCQERRGLTITGGTWKMAIDNEAQYTKAVFHCLTSKDLQEITFIVPIIHGISDYEAIDTIILNCFASVGIKKLVRVTVKYSLLYEDEIGVVSANGKMRQRYYELAELEGESNIWRIR